MIKTPMSLTATVHVRFHYTESEIKAASMGETELLARVLDQATDMDSELQELLVKFANFLNQRAKPKE